jgi:hypothetical protein
VARVVTRLGRCENHEAVLTDAGVQALSELFPDWRVWAGRGAGWHACRRGGYVQDYLENSPAFAVHAGSAAELAGLIRWQEAIEAHGPFACSPGRRPAQPQVLAPSAPDRGGPASRGRSRRR